MLPSDFGTRSRLGTSIEIDEPEKIATRRRKTAAEFRGDPVSGEVANTIGHGAPGDQGASDHAQQGGPSAIPAHRGRVSNPPGSSDPQCGGKRCRRQEWQRPSVGVYSPSGPCSPPCSWRPPHARPLRLNRRRFRLASPLEVVSEVGSSTPRGGPVEGNARRDCRGHCGISRNSPRDGRRRQVQYRRGVPRDL